MTATKPNQMTVELMNVLGCKKESSIYPRLKAIGLLATCTRCGGGGHYSYCQMYGATCFGCNGAGLKLPKITRSVIENARKLWTSEFAAKYAAEVATTAESAKRVKAARDLYVNSKVTAEWKRLSVEAGVSKNWMKEAEYMETNHAKLYQARDALFAVQKKIDGVVINVSGNKMYDKAKKLWMPIDWVTLDKELAPLLAEFAATDVVGG